LVEQIIQLSEYSFSLHRLLMHLGLPPRFAIVQPSDVKLPLMARMGAIRLIHMGIVEFSPSALSLPHTQCALRLLWTVERLFAARHYRTRGVIVHPVDSCPHFTHARNIRVPWHFRTVSCVNNPHHHWSNIDTTRVVNDGPGMDSTKLRMVISSLLGRSYAQKVPAEFSGYDSTDLYPADLRALGVRTQTKRTIRQDGIQTQNGLKVYHVLLVVAVCYRAIRLLRSHGA
jgi:hypothetical protein